MPVLAGAHAQLLIPEAYIFFLGGMDSKLITLVNKTLVHERFIVFLT